MLTDRLYFETLCLTILTGHGIDGMDDKIAELRQKVPLEAFGTGSMLDVNDKQALERITREAKKMLIGRLLADTCNDTGNIFQHALS